jgi:opacity protein-like surface antigen
MRIFSSFLLLAFPAILFAQSKNRVDQINFLAGKNNAKFLYSIGSEKKPTKWISGTSYSLSVNVLLKPKHILRPEINLFQAGAQSSIETLPLEWKLNYLGLGCGYSYKALELKSITLSPGASIGLDYLTKGQQSIGHQRYDLIENNVFNRMNLGMNLFANAQFKVTETLSLLLEYRFRLGLNQIEKDANETTRNISNTAFVGLSFKL